jgi:phosphatidylinositol alpha-1,6-mannosyltransferase
MAARRPIVYLDLGGPPVLIAPEAGIAVPANTPADTVRHLAEAMSRLERDPELRARQGRAGRRHVEDAHAWSARGKTLRAVIAECAGRITDTAQADSEDGG